MPKDIAALSSGDKTAFKAALAGMIYQTPISSDTILSVDRIERALPVGYDNFMLTWDAVTLDFPSELGLLFSFDNGVTWANDTTNRDTYALAADMLIGGGDYPAAPTQSLLGASKWDGAASLTGSDGSFDIHSGCAMIFPGNASRLPRMRVDGDLALAAGAAPRMFRSLVYFSSVSAIPTTPARATNIAFGPTYQGVIGGESVGVSMLSGSLHLFGVPTP